MTHMETESIAFYHHPQNTFLYRFVLPFSEQCWGGYTSYKQRHAIKVRIYTQTASKRTLIQTIRRYTFTDISLLKHSSFIEHQQC